MKNPTITLVASANLIKQAASIRERKMHERSNEILAREATKRVMRALRKKGVA